MYRQTGHTSSSVSQPLVTKVNERQSASSGCWATGICGRRAAELYRGVVGGYCLEEAGAGLYSSHCRRFLYCTRHNLQHKAKYTNGPVFINPNCSGYRALLAPLYAPGKLKCLPLIAWHMPAGCLFWAYLFFTCIVKHLAKKHMPCGTLTHENLWAACATV